ncbi:MAG: FCD domain-containing protein [Nitrospinota bacterium]
MRPEDVEEALLIQARLLPLATRLSVDFVEESDLYFLLGCLDQMEAMALGGDVRGYLLQNQRLISRLLELSRRPQLIKMTERLIKQFLRYEAHLLSITGEMEKMVEGMRSVVDALSARDGDGAERAFQGLIEQTIQSVKSDEYQRIAEQWEKGERTFGDMQITETLEPIAEERIKE